MDTNEINQIYNEYSPQNIYHNLSIDGHKLCSISGVKLDWIHNELLQDNYTISNYQKDNNCIYVNWNKKTKTLNRKVVKREKVYVIKALQGVKFSDYVDSSKNVYAVHVEKYRNWLKEKFKIDETIKMDENLKLYLMPIDTKGDKWNKEIKFKHDTILQIFTIDNTHILDFFGTTESKIEKLYKMTITKPVIHIFPGKNSSTESEYVVRIPEERPAEIEAAKNYYQTTTYDVIELDDIVEFVHYKEIL